MDDETTLRKKVRQIPTGTQTIEESKDPDSCNVYAILSLFLDEQEKKDLRKRYTDG